jgi:hypothetical protein
MLTYSPEDPNPAYGQLLVDVERFEDIAGLIASLQPELEQAFPKPTSRCGSSCSAAAAARRSRPPSVAPTRTCCAAGRRGQGDHGRRPRGARHPGRLAPAGAVVRPRFSVEAAQRAGVLPSDIAAALERNFSGQQIGVYREREKLIPIIARAPAAEREGVEDLRNVQVYSPTAGRFVPVAVPREGRDALGERDHPPRRPLPDDQGAVRPACRALSAPLFERLRPKIEAIELPPGYVLEWHGEHKASTEANEGLAARRRTASPPWCWRSS